MSIQEAWKAFKTVRDEDITVELLKNIEYQNQRTAKIALYDTLKNKLSPEDQKTLRDLEDAETAMESLNEDFYYLAGLRDGLALSQWLIIHEGPNDGNDYLSNCLGAHLNLVAEVSRVE